MAQWKREALEFAQRLDSLLLRCQPAAALSWGGGCEAKNANDAAAAGDALGWDAALAVHEAAAPPLVLDASDLRLLTVQEELVRELGAEPAQQAQQAEQRQEEGPQEEEQQQAAEPALAARAGSEERSGAQQDQVEDGQAQGAAAAGQLQPVAGSAQAPGPAEPLVEPGGAPPELLLASEVPLLGLPGRHVPLVQAVPWAGGSEGAAVDAGGSGGEAATHGGPGTQQQEPQEQQERQSAGACGSTPQDAGQPQGDSLGSDEQQQAAASLQPEQQDLPGEGVARQRKGRQVARPAPAPAAGASVDPQRASPAQQQQQVEPGVQDQHASEGQQEQQTEAGAQQRHATPPEQQAAPAEGQAAACGSQAQQGAAQTAEGELQQEQLAALAGSLAGSLPLLGLQLPLLPLPLPLLSGLPLNPTQEQVEEQPQGKQPRGARQREQQQQQQQVERGGRRHRKRPRWLSDMVDVAAAEQVVQQPDRAAGVELPPALPPLPAQPAKQQAAAPVLPLPATSLEAAAAFGLPAEPGGAPGVPGVPVWDAALAALFGQSQGQQALPLLPWPQLADLLQLPLVPLPADSGATEAETETVEAPAGPDGSAGQRTGGRRGGGRGRGRGGGRRVAKGKSRARPGTVERPAFVEAAIQAALEVKEEGNATLEAYRQRAEAARQRRLDQRQAAAQLLASIADSGTGSRAGSVHHVLPALAGSAAAQSKLNGTAVMFAHALCALLVIAFPSSVSRFASMQCAPMRLHCRRAGGAAAVAAAAGRPQPAAAGDRPGNRGGGAASGGGSRWRRDRSEVRALSAWVPWQRPLTISAPCLACFALSALLELASLCAAACCHHTLCQLENRLPGFRCRVGAGEVVLQVALHVPQAPQFISQEWLVLGSQVRGVSFLSVTNCMRAGGGGHCKQLSLHASVWAELCSALVLWSRSGLPSRSARQQLAEPVHILCFF